MAHGGAHDAVGPKGGGNLVHMESFPSGRGPRQGKDGALGRFPGASAKILKALLAQSATLN
jgi:hypothetical protein